MSKYKFSVLFAVVFTVPLCGYFIVNGYWWLFDGNHPITEKMIASMFLGLTSIFVNIAVAGIEAGEL